MSTPENIPYKPRFKKWQIVLIIIVALGVIAQITAQISGGKTETSLKEYCKYQTNANLDPKCPEFGTVPSASGSSTDGGTNPYRSSDPNTDSLSDTINNSWIPSGFTQYSDDKNLAWRWGTKKETNCSYSSASCWSMIVISNNGCSSLYGEIKIFDSSDIQIDYTNDTTSTVSPLQKVKLTFDTFNDNASGALIGKLSCY